MEFLTRFRRKFTVRFCKS